MEIRYLESLKQCMFEHPDKCFGGEIVGDLVDEVERLRDRIEGDATMPSTNERLRVEISEIADENKALLGERDALEKRVEELEGALGEIVVRGKRACTLLGNLSQGLDRLLLSERDAHLIHAARAALNDSDGGDHTTRVTYREENNPAHNSLTIWVNGANIGRLTVRSVPDEEAVLGRIVEVLDAYKKPDGGE